MVTSQITREMVMYNIQILYNNICLKYAYVPGGLLVHIHSMCLVNIGLAEAAYFEDIG